MGLSLSLLLSPWNQILKDKICSFTDTVETVITRSISFGSKNRELDTEAEKQLLRTHVLLEGLIADEKMKGSGCINAKDHNSINKPEPISSLRVFDPRLFSSPRPISELDDAAIMLQKVYKSYRTRRNLADCAVVVEELWWKALDSAALDHNSISFFNHNEQNTAVSRWYRARRKAARVGKGLLQDAKAQKLALHHWLEAIDPRHRYGRSLRFYFDAWSDRKSYQPFFYWLDVGDGKEVNLPICPRVDLQQQCIQYLAPKERESYEVIIDEGLFMYKQSGILLNTDEDSKWIFVLSTSRTLYVGKKKKGTFQHSSFLCGGVTSAAGRLVARHGVLEAIWPYSGHYLPTEDNFKEFIIFLEDHKVNMTDVKRCSIRNDETVPVTDAEDNSNFKAATESFEFDVPVDQCSMEAQIHEGRIPINTDKIHAPMLDIPECLFREWSSGVSPRIGCVRNYPSELRSQALERVSLSTEDYHSPRYSKNGPPIPSPRPSSNIRVSSRLAYMGFPSPISVTPPQICFSPSPLPCRLFAD